MYVSWIVKELRDEVETREAERERDERRAQWHAYVVAGVSVISVIAMYTLG